MTSEGEMGSQELGKRVWGKKLRFPNILGELAENTRTVWLPGIITAM